MAPQARGQTVIRNNVGVAAGVFTRGEELATASSSVGEHEHKPCSGGRPQPERGRPDGPTE